MQGTRIVNGLSVDVEDWFQVGAFETVIDRARWDGLEDRVEPAGEEPGPLAGAVGRSGAAPGALAMGQGSRRPHRE